MPKPLCDLGILSLYYAIRLKVIGFTLEKLNLIPSKTVTDDK